MKKSLAILPNRLFSYENSRNKTWPQKLLEISRPKRHPERCSPAWGSHLSIFFHNPNSPNFKKQDLTPTGCSPSIWGALYCFLDIARISSSSTGVILWGAFSHKDPILYFPHNFPTPNPPEIRLSRPDLHDCNCEFEYPLRFIPW